MGGTSERNLCYSNRIATALNLALENKEFILSSWGRADNFCRLGTHSLLLIEIEWQQRHPEMNVLKVWAFLKEHLDQKAILIQHIIDRKSVSPNRIRLCKWLEQEMSQSLDGRFQYHLIEDEDLSQLHIGAIKKSIQNLS